MALGITEKRYVHFQQRLAQSKLFRYFWQFWSNYAFAFFIIIFLIIFFSKEFQVVAKSIVVLSATSFICARGILVTLINIFVKRIRPYQKFKFSPITSNFFSLQTAAPNSFPSRHATAYFSVAIIVAAFIPALGAVLIIVGTIAGIARVILGYHWPTDILGGVLIGGGTAWLVMRFVDPLIFT